MQKLSASKKSQYSPWCYTVQLVGVSAYQSKCCHGAPRGSETEQLPSNAQWLFFSKAILHQKVAWEALSQAEVG